MSRQNSSAQIRLDQVSSPQTRSPPLTSQWPHTNKVNVPLCYDPTRDWLYVFSNPNYHDPAFGGWITIFRASTAEIIKIAPWNYSFDQRWVAQLSPQ